MRNQERPTLTEALAALGREYHHLQQEHARQRVEGAHGHALERKLQRTGERFERLLVRWIADEELRDRWIKFFYNQGPMPDEPRIGTPPLFKGVTEQGAPIEVRPSAGGYDVVVADSIARHEALPWHLDPDRIGPIQIGGHTCRETPGVSAEAFQALRDFASSANAEPPWRWLRELFEDGLVDRNFGLTPRGYRLLGKSASVAPRASGWLTFGVLAADAARARIFVLRAENEDEPTPAPLVEVFETMNPERRTRDSDLFRDTRPGLRREGPHGPRHGVSDRREMHRRDVERRFASFIVKQAVRIFEERAVTRVVLVASPAMLGSLRRAVVHVTGGRLPWSVRDFARGLTRLAAPAVHDALAADGLLPPRGRPTPLQASPAAPL
jgi:protein required for attachment to host cells